MRKLFVLTASLMVWMGMPAIAQVVPAPSTDNNARITQTGNQNSATIDQVAGAILNGQGQAEIIQNTSRATAVITQSTATSPRAGGFANTATIDQRRQRTNATVEQVHDYAGVNAFGNAATIVQVAADAQAAILQRGDRNTGTIRQLVGSVAPVASLQQNGVFNRGIIRQGGQTGTVIVRQGDFVSGPGASPVTSNARATVDNNGLNAVININQIGFASEATVVENGNSGLIDIVQYGSVNIASVTQLSTDGEVRIETGSGSQFNIADVLQEAGDVGSTASIYQTGYFSRADITQSDSLGLGGGNDADVAQSGIGTGADSLLSFIVQDGASNSTIVAQSSTYAQSSVVQTGAGHTSQISQ